MKGLADELLRIAVGLVLVAAALSWSVGMIRPFLPLIGVIGVGGIALRYLLRRRGF